MESKSDQISKSLANSASLIPMKSLMQTKSLVQTKSVQINNSELIEIHNNPTVIQTKSNESILKMKSNQTILKKHDVLKATITRLATPSTVYYERDCQNKFYKIPESKSHGCLCNVEEAPDSERIGEAIDLAGCVVDDSCAIINKLVFLLFDHVGRLQVSRQHALLKDYVSISSNGFCIRELHDLGLLLDHMINNLASEIYHDNMMKLLTYVGIPVRLKVYSDKAVYFQNLIDYFSVLSCLLMKIEPEDLYDRVYCSILNLLLIPDEERERNVIKLNVCREAVSMSHMIETVTRMIGFCTSHRYQSYIDMALLFASIKPSNALQMMRFGIIENIFYRFNPYFPDSDLPETYEHLPVDPNDPNIKLGDSSKILHKTLLLSTLVIYNTLRALKENEISASELKVPDSNSLRCFSFVFKYECRVYDHTGERNSLLIILYGLIKIFGQELRYVQDKLMPDLVSLSVHSELKSDELWIREVNFVPAKNDAKFKIRLIKCCVLMFKTFVHNYNLMEAKNWVIGLMYLIDPCHEPLRLKWSVKHYNELRNCALHALVCTISPSPLDLTSIVAAIRRTLWYVEWYTIEPYQERLLYWNLRVLGQATEKRKIHNERNDTAHKYSIQTVKILTRLCSFILENQPPPLSEELQVIITQAISILTSVMCFLKLPSSELRNYCSDIFWPSADKEKCHVHIMNVVIAHINNNFPLSNRLLIALLNFIWCFLVPEKNIRKVFLSRNGIHNLLNIIDASESSVQCIGLAVLVDLASTGETSTALISWKKCNDKSIALPNLLARIFKEDCISNGIIVNTTLGIIGDKNHPLMCSDHRDELRSIDEYTCDSIACKHMAGSRSSKIYALLYLLGENLKSENNVDAASYHLYKNCELNVDEEMLLITCTHYMMCKISETWHEINVGMKLLKDTHNFTLLPEDRELLNQLLELCKIWDKEVHYENNQVLKRNEMKENDKLNSFYKMLSKHRVQVTLEALHILRWDLKPSKEVRFEHLRDVVMASLGDEFDKKIQQIVEDDVKIDQWVSKAINKEKKIEIKKPKPSEILLFPDC